jgi:glycosyltransferase involved in cell wall biosynthesis
MFVSIIIPTFNRPDELTICLLALANQFVPDTLHFEVIISDDSSSCSARTLLHHHQFSFARWVRGAGIGPAANRNNGAAHARGDWFAFLDDDCIPDDDYLEKIAEAIIANPDTGILEGYTYPGRERIRYDEETVTNLSGGRLWSCNMLIRRKLFLQLRGFCEEFPSPAMEDIDLHLTIKQRRIPIHFCPAIKVCHPWRKRKPLSFKLQMISSIRLLCRRHPSAMREFNKRTYLKHLIAGLGGRTRRLFRYRFRGTRAYFEDNLILFYYLLKL